MNYFLNEYSLRGQFKDVDEFFESLRNCTLPVLRKIEEHKDNVIWKKDTFWESEICNGITLYKIPKKKNERTNEKAALQNQLIKLISQNPFWEEMGENDLDIRAYMFDEEYKENFVEPNCFSKAIEHEGRIVSFIHPSYYIANLPIVVRYNGLEKEYNLDNIYDSTWWISEPEIKTWNISRKYIIQVRAREFEFHPPHFHVIYNEYEAVFRLSDGKPYKLGKKKLTTQMIGEIQEWYKIHKQELQKAWELLHNG